MFFFFTEVIKFYWLMLLLYPGELYRLLGASSLFFTQSIISSVLFCGNSTLIYNIFSIQMDFSQIFPMYKGKIYLWKYCLNKFIIHFISTTDIKTFATINITEIRISFIFIMRMYRQWHTVCPLLWSMRLQTHIEGQLSGRHILEWRIFESFSISSQVLIFPLMVLICHYNMTCRYTPLSSQ